MNRKPIRILIEPSDYIIRNLGDTAMLRVAVSRLSSLLPNSHIQVFSDVPAQLPFICSNVVPLSSRGRRLWFAKGFLLGGLNKRLSPAWRKRSYQIERLFRWQLPALVERLLKFRLRRTSQFEDLAALNEFLEVISRADLVLASGMGGITDAFPEYASELLEVLQLAKRHGAATALMGQGIGPLDDPALRANAARVLPQIDFIALREERSSGPLLEKLGIVAQRTMTTGDDAIEVAYAARSKKMGAGVGVNVRMADYAEVNETVIKRLRPTLAGLATIYQASLIPIPISFVPSEEDTRTISYILSRCEQNGSLAQEVDSIEKVLAEIGRCRVVIAGSYHAAVFSLSQGIPTIGLFNSRYYQDKFLGLAEQFGSGCQVICLEDDELETKLEHAFAIAWNSAERVRPQLLAAATQQIKLSYKAYRTVQELVLLQRQRVASEQGQAAN